MEDLTKLDQLDKIFKNAHDQLVILIFYKRSNPAYPDIKYELNKLARMYTCLVFCFIDANIFCEDSRIMTDYPMPKFCCYHLGNLIGTFVSADMTEIQDLIKSAEHYVFIENLPVNPPTNQSSWHTMDSVMLENLVQNKIQQMKTHAMSLMSGTRMAAQMQHHDFKKKLADRNGINMEIIQPQEKNTLALDLKQKADVTFLSDGSIIISPTNGKFFI
jgi:hypothetical protein